MQGNLNLLKIYRLIKNILIRYIKIVAKDFTKKEIKLSFKSLFLKPKFSGVIFTRNINNNSPYYFINFDKSGLTDLITSGRSNPSMKTIIINREKNNKSWFFFEIFEKQSKKLKIYLRMTD